MVGVDQTSGQSKQKDQEQAPLLSEVAPAPKTAVTKTPAAPAPKLQTTAPEPTAAPEQTVENLFATATAPDSTPMVRKSPSKATSKTPMLVAAGIGGVVHRLAVLQSEEYLTSAIPREWNEFFAKGVALMRGPSKISN